MGGRTRAPNRLPKFQEPTSSEAGHADCRAKRHILVCATVFSLNCRTGFLGYASLFWVSGLLMKVGH